jgi:hypothetical protein
VIHGYVKDSVEHVGGELLLCCMAGCDWVAHHLTISADTGQHSLLSYYLDLGLTVGVACRAVQMVYLVVQDAGPTEFFRVEDGACSLIWQDIGTAGMRILM